MTPVCVNGQRPGVTVWLTGLPSSGKSTIARAVADVLRAEGRAVEILDGDELRRTISPELGFSRADRERNVHRVGLITRLLARNGIIVLVPVIAPYEASRTAVRDLHTSSLVGYVEVHVATPLEVCMARDVKGLYARRTAGLTGVDDPYEVPVSPHLRIHTEHEAVTESAIRLLTYLRTAGWLHSIPTETATAERR